MPKKITFRMKTTSILNNEDGVVMIAALMVLVLLTIIGIASTNISNTEIRISTHELIHQQNFYRAEGASLLALDTMEEMGNPKEEDPDWLWQRTGIEANYTAFTEEMAYESDLWSRNKGDTFTWDADTVNQDAAAEPVDPDLLPDTSYLVNYLGVCEKESLEIGVTKRYCYNIYGRSAPPDRGSTTVEIGYIKAF